jgi:hypothetical protein
MRKTVRRKSMPNDTCKTCHTRVAIPGTDICDECVVVEARQLRVWAEQLMRWTNPTFKRDQNEPVYPLARLH